jgi:MFS family permease
MNVAISAVVVDLHTDLSTIQALIAIYALTTASLMLAGSKLQDVLGMKKTFLIGLIVYGIGTTTATLSVNVIMLLIGWSLLEGIGAALMLPATTTMVSAAYEGKDRLTAFGIWGGIAALGAAIGPLYGGALTSFATWRLIFAFELLGVLAVIVMRSYLRESKPRLAWRDIDLGGVVLSVAALFSLVFGILLLGSPQYWQLVPLFIGVGLIVFAAFLLWQRRRISHDVEPLLDISMLKNRLYVLGNAASAIQQIACRRAVYPPRISAASHSRERLYDRRRLAPHVGRNFRAIAHRGQTLVYSTTQDRHPRRISDFCCSRVPFEQRF